MSVKEETLTLSLGPQHPSTHGVFRMVLQLEGERVIDVVPHMGYLHRGFEKLAERRTVVQYQPYPDRWDYLSAMFNESAYIGAVEALAGIEAPPRAQYLRALVMEMNRISSHLLFFGTFLLDVGALSPFLYAFREREMILDLFMELCGARLTYNYLRIGGVGWDATPKWLHKVAKAVPYFRKKIQEYRWLVDDNPIFRYRTERVGVLDTGLAQRLAITGPVARGSGVNIDLRRDRPYGIYGELDVPVAVEHGGDVWSRYLVRMEEMENSLTLIEQILDRMPAGPIMGKVPKNVRLPAGEAYYAVESPRGELGVYLVGDGSANAYRMKVRPPTMINLHALKPMLVGHMVADAVVILGSIDIVLGEVDR
ncbi:NADH:quinone oxidoreductase subunit D [Candidatus Hydrogenisulfobacillus filiaventi]|uniref:NADH-quinone oxidoreductase subunit D n=1 Tax=Candidatus Hydrogenisulfobacillus filiaventi TaxID=2707344 RepID=A0A6F8ZIT6_9FIRM|nr:NADH-quinone oxidoreductase subunit D [Bacillota bacterium]CAB1129852.1 NADH:quinone oxidoreductase subunit D [Candidatus Hydrogenisulfobacillus filiaventi]